MQSQVKSSRPAHNGQSTARPEYTAAVRYRDGRQDIFHVRNADDLADARAMVLAELGDVRSLVISLRA